MNLAVSAMLTAVLTIATIGGYSSGGGPWNVRACATTKCDVVGQMPDGPIPDLMCQLYGERVTLGTYEARIWNRVRTPSGAVGYLTDAGVNETPGYDFDPRLPRCAGSHGGSVYFKPRDWWPFDPTADADYVADLSDWSIGQCSSLSGGNYPDIIDGKQVTTLAGWSLGRLGPSYAMQHNMSRVQANVDSIVLYDPGSSDEYLGDGSCDRYLNQSHLYAEWLESNPNKRLLILAGAVTRDKDHPGADGRYHQGIQQVLFPEIRGTAQAAQVLVCNYDELGHDDVLRNFAGVVRNGPQSGCPSRPGLSPDDHWHP